MVANERQWEVGSEYHWQGIPKGPFIKWPKPHNMFATAREALLSVWRFSKFKSSNVLFVPNYFCEEVVAWWMNQGIKIRRFSDGPQMASPIWDTLRVSKDDAVLVVNYFGVRNGEIWEQWRNANNGVLVIEDHSHDPLSYWALNSEADFAFASLRKTFPVSDGAILWSPKGLPLSNKTPFNNWRGSSFKLAAMVLKRHYLESGGSQVKAVFRGLQTDGEKLLGNAKISGISPWSKFLLSYGYPVKWRERREENVRLFINLIVGSPLVKPLFDKWPMGHCPFNSVLLYPTREDREEYRSRLLKMNVYPSVHWKLNLNAPPNFLDLSSRIMTIPIDQRYNEEDVNRVVSILLSKK